MNDVYILLSTVVISGLVSYITARIPNYSRDVVAERRKWREKIRELTIQSVAMIYDNNTQSPEYLSIVSEFRVRLNPDDNFDKELIAALEEGFCNPGPLLARKILAQVSRLLKHDWDRAKAESRFLNFRGVNEKEIRRLRSEDYLK